MSICQITLFVIYKIYDQQDLVHAGMCQSTLRKSKMSKIASVVFNSRSIGAHRVWVLRVSVESFSYLSVHSYILASSDFRFRVGTHTVYLHN